MKLILLTLILFLNTIQTYGQNLPGLKVSDNRRYLVTENDSPFFWLGGTAWELIHRLNKEEIEFYLNDRANKGFTVIQTVILAELNGLTTPNAYGQLPLINNDPTKLNEKYFEHVDFVINQAEHYGLYVGLLPTWGDKFSKKWGTGPEIFSPENAEIYGELLAERYQNQDNIIWILGGDRIPETEEHYEIVRAMAKGLRKLAANQLISYHPSGAKAATEFFNDAWLDVDMFQSGHSRVSKEFEYVIDSKNKVPARPVINGESRYENIPDRFWQEGHSDWLDDTDVRISAYWTMLSGAAGYTYGCNDIWQMYAADKDPVIEARTGWKQAIYLPGSGHMKFMKELLEVFPWQQMIINQSLILNDNPENELHIVCAEGADNDFIIAYTPGGLAMNIDLPKLRSQKVKAFWFNPRSGISKKIGEFSTAEPYEFKPWADGWGSDFVLVVMDIKAPYILPH
jgi:hypothetical protein